jgi:TolB protein
VPAGRFEGVRLSPDGKRLAAVRRSGVSASDIWLFDLERPVPSRFTFGPSTNYYPSWSPDGSRIAFTAIDGNDTDVWTCNPDGSGARRLTSSPALDLSPSWSPDGKRIAFVSDRAGSPQLYVMNADGSEQRRLTFQGNYNQTPQWSPRGDLILFTARDERRVFDVFVVGVDGARIQRLTQDQGRTNEEPTWAPNGRMVAFTSDRLGTPQLLVSDPRGERQSLITGGAELMTPAWGPFPPD